MNLPGARNIAGAHKAITAHNGFNPANRMNKRSEFAHNQFGGNQAARTRRVRAAAVWRQILSMVASPRELDPLFSP